MARNSKPASAPAPVVTATVTEPVVVPDHDSGTQDPILLLDTMEYFYTKFLKAEELKVKTLVNIEQLRKKLEHGDRNDSQNK